MHIASAGFNNQLYTSAHGDTRTYAGQEDAGDQLELVKHRVGYIPSNPLKDGGGCAIKLLDGQAPDAHLP